MPSRAGGERLSLSPMLCTSAETLPEDTRWTFEPKYDGIRVIAYATARSASLQTRNGNEKARQFPEVVSALRTLAEAVGPLVLDGEIVATNGGKLARFGELQGRMHLRGEKRIEALMREKPAAFVAFDLLMQGDESLLQEDWSARRQRLEEIVAEDAGTLRRGETSKDGAAMLARATAEGWEGIVAKRTDSHYRPGARSGSWLKVKLESSEEFVVGGWTEPRGSRTLIGALLLGYFSPNGKLEYAGHTGTGFDRAALADMHRRLKRLERKTPPFREAPETNERPHWVTPRVVVQVRFNEWTRHGTLRQPVFLGVREDRVAREVVYDPEARGGQTGAARARSDSGGRRVTSDSPLIRALEEIESRGDGGGPLELPDGSILPVTSLGKTFFPVPGHTKGDLLRYYVAVWEVIRPWMEDRALVLKRYPDGVAGKSFYQQSPPASVPDGVRVEEIRDGENEVQRRLVGGDLITLLYTIQMGAVSYDPWHSRIDRLETADYTIIDLDPGPGATFGTVVEVAARVKEEMDELGLHGALKTSGSSGLHIYLPLPQDTPLDAATLVAQIVATRVARKHPRIATIERMTRNRPEGTIYVDYLQNILGKTVAGVYAARAREGATVSTPLAWEELDDTLDRSRFTITSVPERLDHKGDLWGEAMSRPNSLDRLLPGD